MSRYVPPAQRGAAPSLPASSAPRNAPSFRRSALVPASSEDFPSLGRPSPSRASVACPSPSAVSVPSSSASLGGRTPPPVPPVPSASATASPATTALSNRYADLARSWGIQKKEEEEKTKKAEKDSVLQARLLREKEEKERRFFRISATNATALLNRQAVDDIPLEDDRVVIDDYESGEEVVEEEESESGYDAEELDAGWNQRRHKNELY